MKQNQVGKKRGNKQIHLKNNVMIGYRYTFEPSFSMRKNSFSAVPLNLTRFTELINQQL